MGKTFLKATQQSVKRLKNKQTYNPKIPVVDTDLKGIAVNVTKIYIYNVTHGIIYKSKGME